MNKLIPADTARCSSIKCPHKEECQRYMQHVIDGYVDPGKPVMSGDFNCFKPSPQYKLKATDLQVTKWHELYN